MGKRVKKQKHEVELVQPEVLSEDVLQEETKAEVLALRRVFEKLSGPCGDNIFGRDEKDVFRLCFLNNQSVDVVASMTDEPTHYIKRVKKQVSAILAQLILEELENV